jgi:hypothetical protein
MRKKHKFPIFYTILVLFIIMAVIAIDYAIGEVSEYLADYESTQPKYVAEEIFSKYYKSYDFDSLVTLAGLEVPEYESRENLIKYLHSLYDGCDMTYHSGVSEDKKDPSGTKKLKYEVQFGNSAVSSFSIKSGDKKSVYDFDIFEPDQFEFKYTAEKSVRVTALSHYTVLINGKKAEQKHIIESDIKTDSCSHMPEGVGGLTYCTYQVTELLFDPEVKVLDPEGKESTLTYDKEKGTYKADIIYSDSLKEQYSEYVLTAIKKYSAFMGNDEKWGNIKIYFDSSSKLYKSIGTSLNMFVIDHSGYYFVDENASEFYAYDENTFSCRVSFTHVMTKPGKPDYKDKIDMTIYLRKVGDKFLIYDRYDH